MGEDCFRKTYSNSEEIVINWLSKDSISSLFLFNIFIENGSKENHNYWTRL